MIKSQVSSMPSNSLKPTLSDNSLKIISLGGYGEVNRNMFIYELPDDGDIIIIDCGIGFPTEEMLGVDLLIPDISYLNGKEHRIKGMLITHGHEDHVGGLPYILPKLPKFPIYASRLTAALGENKLQEYQITRSIQIIDPHKTIQLGSFTVKSIRVNHSIPDTLHYYIHTPLATVYHGTDFKFDWTPIDNVPPEVGKITSAGNQGIDLLISDCLGSERKTTTRSELELNEMFSREINDCKGKFIVTAISSSISRLQQAINASLQKNRKIVPVGRSIEKNITIATELGYLNINPQALITKQESQKYPNNQLTFLVAGSQGQPGSALQKIAFGEHQLIEIEPGDKVLFSADESIPGSEITMHAAIDALYKAGATVVYSDIKDDLHISGHGSQPDLKLLLGLTRPKSVLPIGGNYRHMVHYKILAENMGYQPHQILMPLSNHTVYVNHHTAGLDKKINLRNVMVDGLGVGDVGNIILRDRQVLAEEGLVIVLLQLDINNLSLVGDPDIITRGFVYTKGEDSILTQAKNQIKQILKPPHNYADWHSIKEATANTLQKHFSKQLNRHPMILPVIIEV
jgi:ribonuclease J